MRFNNPRSNPASKREAQNIKSRKYEEEHWFGGQTTAQSAIKGPQATYKGRIEWNEKKDAIKQDKSQKETRITLREEQGANSSVRVGNKTPYELMNDLLKVVGSDREQAHAYYSRQTEELISDLLTNKYKLNSYLNQLQSSKRFIDPEISQNYEILALLLQATSNNDIAVKQHQNKIELVFNPDILSRQQIELQRLQTEKEVKQKEMKELVSEYEGIVDNFNEIISKMISKMDQDQHNNL